MQIRNNIQLIGNLGTDPVEKMTSTDRPLATFPVATSARYRNAAGERIERTEWHNCVAWGKQAETVAAYLKKGSRIALNGELRYSVYTDVDGKKRRSAEIHLSDFTFLDGRKSVPAGPVAEATVAKLPVKKAAKKQKAAA